uniref:NYN domain-containing protein n=1 Tax=Noccaea caerulescens TaxID=107243 RepID=A0A1J3D4H8_NOCCA
MTNKNNTAAEAPYDDAQTWVCWDIEKCPVPRGCKADKIAGKIRSALVKLNYRGPISISAYGNMDHIPPSIKKTLSSTGIVLKHVHPGEFRLHVVNKITFWPFRNPAPANIMVISRDESLYFTFPELQSEGYNILLAHPANASDYFIASAKTTWLWRRLLEEPEITEP